MISTKRATTFLVVLALAFLAQFTLSAAPAQADDKKPTPGAITFQNGDDDDDHEEKRSHREDGDEDEDEENEHHHERLREQYGEVEQVYLPPLVVTDPSGLGGNGFIVPKPGEEADSGRLLDATNVDPRRNAPIDPKTIRANGQTPADSFFQLASVAIGSMAAGSIALGAFAVRRTVRLRNTADADYIYK